MDEQLQGFPFWLVTFDKHGALLASDVAHHDVVRQLIADLKSQAITDLFIFSHGWNNDRETALALYNKFFAQVREVLDASKPTRNAHIGVVGILWPSILWPDDAENATMDYDMTDGNGAAYGEGPPVPEATTTPAQIHNELSRGYDTQEQLELISELTDMLKTQGGTDQALEAFRVKLGALLQSETGQAGDNQTADAVEGAITSLDYKQWRALLDRLGDVAVRAEQGGGGVGIGDVFSKLWAGAKDALRISTYWQMKQRAGVVGRVGLGQQVLTRVASDAPDTRVHLLGHSFGARLVSYSLAGLPETVVGKNSPVKSLFLLQGAFSHFAFADRLPQDATRSGALKGMATRVDGPLLTTYSQHDLAVGRLYPVASFLSGDDAAEFEEKAARWGGMGCDGAQAVDAAHRALAKPETTYPFAPSQWLNLDGNDVIVHGGLPSGAHSDIAHPHTAWAALAAAGIVGKSLDLSPAAAGSAAGRNGR